MTLQRSHYGTGGTIWWQQSWNMLGGGTEWLNLLTTVCTVEFSELKDKLALSVCLPELNVPG